MTNFASSPLQVHLVGMSFNWISFAVAVIGLGNLIAGVTIAVTSARRDNAARADQRAHDAAEREKERTYAEAQRDEARANEQHEEALAEARNIIGGPPKRVREAMTGFAEAAAGPNGLGPTVINATASVISDIQLFGAFSHGDPWNPRVAESRWYPARRTHGGQATVILPGGEMEFAPQWVSEYWDEDTQRWISSQEHFDVSGLSSLRVAFRWTDARGVQWIRQGHDEPKLFNDFTIEDLGRVSQEWGPHNSQDG